MSHDPAAARRILPHNAQPSQAAQMDSFAFAPQAYPPRETQRNYVFVDEHNRHKRLKVMRACEGCRRRKIKCDAATSNNWPCSACLRLKLTCVRPNGFDGAPDTVYDQSMVTPDQFQQQMQMQMQHPHPHQNPHPHPHQHQQHQTSAASAAAPRTAPNNMYAQPQHAVYQDAGPSAYHNVPYDAGASGHPGGSVHYSQMSAASQVPVMDQHYAQQGVFPTPPPPLSDTRQEPSPEAYTPDSFQQQDLADLLGGLKVDEKGTAPYLRNKASFRREEEPAFEDDDEKDLVPPLPRAGPGSKIRIPPALMPDEEDALRYIDAFFTNVHPYVPVLDKVMFYHQWHTSRESISPLILEAVFALGGRLEDDPSDGHTWLALASRHADAFMDTPRLSTLQGLLLLLKAREAAPKRGYYYRSWMTIVQCVQMGIDLGLDEHLEDHEMGRGCDSSPAECQLRRRIWQTCFVCEVMVGAPQGRFDLSVPFDSVDFDVPRQIPGSDDSEYYVTRHFTYFARVVRNVRKMSVAYVKVKKRKEWGIEPEMQELIQGFDSWLADLPPDLVIDFPADGSPPWLPSTFVGNLHSYYYLTLILYNRPQLQFIDLAANPMQWKHHMMICYDAAKKLCRLQEAIINTAGLEGLQNMQRGFSFTVYGGLSCICLHLVAVVSPDPDLNTDAAEFFTRHVRIMEKVMEVWAMPELRPQVEAIREAFSADIRKPFALKPSFPYGSPHPSDHSSPTNQTTRYRPVPILDRTLNQNQNQSQGQNQQQQQQQQQHLDAQQGGAHNVSYYGHPISPPVSAGALDSKSDSPAGQPLVMMTQGGQAHSLPQSMSLVDQPTWNPSRIFENWNASFGTPAQSDMAHESQTRPLNLSSPGAGDIASLQDYSNPANQMGSSAQISPPQYTAPPFMTPAMWQESVASVYEGGLKRTWDFDGSGPPMKRR